MRVTTAADLGFSSPLGMRVGGGKKIRHLIIDRWMGLFGGCCPVCGDEMSAPAPNEAQTGPKTATRDHIIPQVFGGSSEPDNIRVICKACNSAKSTIEGKIAARDGLPDAQRAALVLEWVQFHEPKAMLGSRS